MRFEEICQKQMNWGVPDRDLRDSLILMIAEILLPAYRSFLKHFGYFPICSGFTTLFYFFIKLLKTFLLWLCYGYRFIM